MAYEHGSTGLGIQNPFKFEGGVRAARGIITAVVGLIALLQVQGLVESNKIMAWASVAFGVFCLIAGLRIAGLGLMQVLRFFVGRSVPSSLARNFSRSEQASASQLTHDITYNSKQLEQMLMGRVNTTFVEPVGLIARVIHSFLPKLTFLPYPVRNLIQRLGGALLKTALALVCYLLAAFTVNTGLMSGEGADFALSCMSAALLVYLLVVWWRASKGVNRAVARQVEKTSSLNVGVVVALAILTPVLASSLYGWLTSRLDVGADASASYAQMSEQLAGVASAWLLLLVALLAVLSVVGVSFLTRYRASQSNPLTEVSEYRDNWQENVHPQDVFIHIDNIVMANMRYKEIPNRVYRDLEPQLKQQAEDKGSFFGELIQETQPVYKELSYPRAYTLIRKVMSAISQLLLLAALPVIWFTFTELVEVITLASGLKASASSAAEKGQMITFLNTIFTVINLAFLATILTAFGRLLSNYTHVFWAEICFESLLVYFKCEGTFTESKLSTGSGIYDSTRSENTVVRSSMTPWLVASRLVTSTYAATGAKNLEWPRHILELHKDEARAQSIIGDLQAFLQNRESIASVKNEKDLAAADNLYQINQQTRSVPPAQGQVALTQEGEAAGGLLQREVAEVD